MQPVSMLMSNLNVEANTHHAPNAMAVAQDTGQSQEIIREGIKVVQTVQASEAASEAQRVHRKNENDQREGRQSGGDTFERSKRENDDNPGQTASLVFGNKIESNIKTQKSFEFYA